MHVKVIKAGLLTTLQDAGRPGYAHLGIGRAGAFDAPALRLANALCDNPGNACALEMTVLGPTLRFDAPTWIAVTGAPVRLRVDGAERPAWAPVFVPMDATVALGAMREGCRSYLAVRGGFDTPPVLGSRSTDVNGRIGPFGGRALRAGDSLNTLPNTSPARPSAAPTWQLDPRPWFAGTASDPLRLLPGSQLDRLTIQSCKLLFYKSFIVEKDSNRVGVRLAGPHLDWASPTEMTSEGCLPGLLQLPPSGRPIAFGPECPVSGGYPRIGQVAAVDLPRLAQCRPGDALGFQPCSLEAATDALAKRERALKRLEAVIRTRLKADPGFRRAEPAVAPER